MPEPEQPAGSPGSDLASWRFWECGDCGTHASCKYIQVPGRMEPSFCPATRALCRWREGPMPTALEPTRIQLEQKIDQIVLGRRYLVAEVAKLRVSVEDFKGVIEKAKSQSIAGAVAEMRTLTETTTPFWSQMRHTVEEIAAAITRLSAMASKIQDGLKKGAND